MWEGCWSVRKPHLHSLWSSVVPRTDPDSDRAASFCCRGALGLAAASADLEKTKEAPSVASTHPQNCHGDSLPSGFGHEQRKQYKPIVIKVFKVSASVLLLKKPNLSEAAMMKLVFTETKWPQPSRLAWEPRRTGTRDRQDMLSALRHSWQTALPGSCEFGEIDPTTLHPSRCAAMLPSELIRIVLW